MSRLAWFACLLTALVACGDDGIVAVDASALDAGVRDAAFVDAATCPPPSGACEPMACPEPQPGRVTICGQLYDLATEQRVGSAGAAGCLCDPGSPAEQGPCSVRVSPGPAEIDDCGQFRIVDTSVPLNGLVDLTTRSVAVDGPWINTTELVPVAAGDRITDKRAYVTSHASDEQWTATAGDPFGGQSFSERGAVVVIFRHGGEPVAGVSATSGGTIRPDDDYYFSDTAPASRTTVDPSLTATGATGSGIVANVTLGQVSGVGGLPAGCEWSSKLGASATGYLLVTPIRAVLTSDPGADCP